MAMGLVQVGRAVPRLEVVGERRLAAGPGLFAQGGQFLAAFGDQLVVVVGRQRGGRVVAHGAGAGWGSVGVRGEPAILGAQRRWPAAGAPKIWRFAPALPALFAIARDASFDRHRLVKLPAPRWPARPKAQPPMAVPEAPAWSLRRAVATLLAGGLMAQALPLLLGPLIARLCLPADFGQYTAFAAVAANLAVVACARYEFALPMERDDASARALFDACLALLGVATLLSAALALALGALGLMPGATWLAPAVAVAGGLSLLTWWANRSERFNALAVARLLQYGGGALAQWVLVLAWPGPAALIAGPVAAAVLAAAYLWRDAPVRPLGRSRWTERRAVLKRHLDFPLLNAPHAFLGAAGDTAAVLLIAAWSGDMALGWWGLAIRYLKAPATLVGSAVSQALYPRLADGPTAQARASLRQVMVWLGVGGALLGVVLVVGGPALFAPGLWRALAAGRGTRARAGTVHRAALRGLAAGCGHDGLAGPGLGAAAGDRWTMPVHRGAGGGPRLGGADSSRLGRVGHDGPVFRLVLPSAGHLEGVRSWDCG